MRSEFLKKTISTSDRSKSNPFMYWFISKKTKCLRQFLYNNSIPHCGVGEPNVEIQHVPLQRYGIPLWYWIEKNKEIISNHNPDFRSWKKQKCRNGWNIGVWKRKSNKHGIKLVLYFGAAITHGFKLYMFLVPKFLRVFVFQKTLRG